MKKEQTEKIYKTVQAFKQALGDRLLSISVSEKIPLDRLRRRIAFERFLARLFDKERQPEPDWLLKGAYALEIRFADIARTTKDIDMAIPSMESPSPEKIREVLSVSAKRELNDWFAFSIGEHTKDLTQPLYGGWRYPVECLLSDRTFSKFHVDVVVGDIVVDKPDWYKGVELLSFAGIEPAEIAIYPKAQHFAEKIHSYTFPRENREKSRVRDLVDIAILIENGLPKEEDLIIAIKATFDRRKTHEMPESVDPPPDRWQEAYKKLAQECGVKSKTVQEAFVLLSTYWENIFNKEV